LKSHGHGQLRMRPKKVLAGQDWRNSALREIRREQNGGGEAPVQWEQRAGHQHPA
jgi:hypothetical protein